MSQYSMTVNAHGKMAEVFFKADFMGGTDRRNPCPSSVSGPYRQTGCQ
jgi:hypothetical protein